MSTHVVLFDIDGDKINRVEYILSKFKREPGDKMKVGGREMVVGITASTRNEAIQAANQIIKQYNRIQRMKKKKDDVEFEKLIIDIARQTMKELNRDI